MTQQKWTAADLPAMTGRTVVVTGASSGLGLITARQLASAGARVVLAVRDEARGHSAAATMPGTTEVRQLDLGSQASVRAFAAAWTGPLDILINNAGIMQVPRARTSDGFEVQIATNHLGPFALTILLLPHITASTTAHCPPSTPPPASSQAAVMPDPTDPASAAATPRWSRPARTPGTSSSPGGCGTPPPGSPAPDRP
jgi:NAD(P)-dependent dehydrogenase (short-subunit alcohol dehydrogenase family)